MVLVISMVIMVRCGRKEEDMGSLEVINLIWLLLYYWFVISFVGLNVIISLVYELGFLLLFWLMWLVFVV